MTFSADDQYFVSCSNENAVKIWDTATGQSLYTLQNDTEINIVALSPNGRCLAASTLGMGIRVWDIREHSFKILEGHTHLITSLAFSADSLYLASSTYNQQIKIWDLEQHTCLHTINVGKEISHLSFDLWTNSQLHTDIGVLDLNILSQTPDVNAESIWTATSPGSDWSSHFVHISGEWIVKDGENVLWLPSDYRPWSSAVFKSTVAIGCDSGRVLIMKFT